jgi:hypothetical protein
VAGVPGSAALLLLLLLLWMLLGVRTVSSEEDCGWAVSRWCRKPSVLRPVWE